METYEKLGAFYLGKRWDPAKAERTDELVLYDSSDLTTHAVIIGMTGSGKTGLGIGLLEEAALDRIPVIAIDPKGDLGNLMLCFPGLNGADLSPWVDPKAAQARGQTVAAYAEAEAQAWRKGLADFGQTPERIARLREAADFALYTPGSTAGRPLAALAGFAAPPEAVRADPELYRQHLQGVVSGLLALTGSDADPTTSREHILIATLLDGFWQKGQGPDLAGLIGAVQRPGVERVGALDMESFYPAKERFALALRLNNLLAAPGFQAWLEGEPLDPGRLLFTAAGQPRVSVISIAHLNDAERMFLVTLLLNSLVSYMRAQPGTSSLRAILYMDEVMGYLPPVATPASKAPLLTLLKQARAFGIGVVLATQNPVDLDYKALSNAGTWFIGRLQTEQDRNRVRDGLRSAAADKLDSATIDGLLAGLGKRTFLLHNVHESGPLLFQTRTTLAYLRGPLTREDIRRLSGPAAAAPVASPAAGAATPVTQSRIADARPVLPPGLPVSFAEPSAMPGHGERLVYLPRLLGAARVHWQSPKHQVDLTKELVLALDPGAGPLDWAKAETLDLKPELLARDPEPDAGFGTLPAGLMEAGQARSWQSAFQAWLRTGCTLTLQESPAVKLLSTVDETEGAFRARLQQAGREARDLRVAALRQKYASRLATLEEKIRRAEQGVERERQQVTDSGLNTAVSIGSAVLGALLGRKTLSATNAGRVSTAIRRAGNLRKQSGDVDRASETVAALKEQLAGLEAEAQAAIDGLPAYDAATEELQIINLRPKAADVTVQFCGIGWLPHIEDGAGKLRRV